MSYWQFVADRVGDSIFSGTVSFAHLDVASNDCTRKIIKKSRWHESGRGRVVELGQCWGVGVNVIKIQFVFLYETVKE